MNTYYETADIDCFSAHWVIVAFSYPSQQGHLVAVSLEQDIGHQQAKLQLLNGEFLFSNPIQFCKIVDIRYECYAMT